MASSTNQGSLIELEPGEYLIAGQSNDIFYKCDKKMYGIVLHDTRDYVGKLFSHILVDGKVIVLWEDRK